VDELDLAALVVDQVFRLVVASGVLADLDRAVLVVLGAVGSALALE